MNSLLSALFALMIGGTALYYALPLLVDAQMQPAQNDAGNQLAVLEQATIAYMQVNATALQADIQSRGKPSTKTVSDLQFPPSPQPPYLSTSFRDFNVFGQHHAIAFSQQIAGQLEALIYTYGGDTIPDGIAIRVAESGPANSVVILTTDPTFIDGAAGGEQVPLSVFQNTDNPITTGHIGVHIIAAAYSAEAPFLNRYATGNLDDNTMHTALYMGDQEINMGTSAATTSGGSNINMAGGNITFATQVGATIFADPNTPTYQVTPAGQSNISALTVTGNVIVDGTATATTYLHLSDARLKENIRSIENPLGIVEQLEGHTFDWKRDGKTDIGFVAQEVQKILPEAVVTSPEGHLAVKYDVLTAPLVEAVKVQAAQIDRLNEAVSQKSAEIDQLRGAIDRLDKGDR